MAKIEVELEGNADAVEFCPNEPYLHILAAASYTLQEGEQGSSAARLGGLYLFSADQGEESSSSRLGLTKLYHRETAGVFDIKWRPQHGPSCLAQASADGSLCLHKLEEGPGTSTLELHENAVVVVGSSMCLYVDWNPLRSDSEVVVSHSDGSISLVDLGQSEPKISASWQAHDFEAWVVAYDSWKPHVVYSGGDDCQFCCWDLRDKPSHQVFSNKKSHRMGVCSIQSNALWENMLVTGSYDESVRLFDVRMTQKPLLKAELGLGGGVWRLKWHHTRKDILLAACMHNGAAIVRLGEEGFQVLEQYKEHKSLTYGASWCRGYVGDSVDPGHNILDGDTRLDAQGDERFCSSDVATSGTKEVLRTAIEETLGAGQSLIAESITHRDNGYEVRSSVNSRQMGLKASIRTKPLVATCSFYDRAVHLWRPQKLQPKVT